MVSVSFFKFTAEEFFIYCKLKLPDIGHTFYRIMKNKHKINVGFSDKALSSMRYKY